MVAKQGHRCRENPGLVPVHDLAEGGLIAAVEAPNEVGIVYSFGIHSGIPLPFFVPTDARHS
jgi:hypothetical protein